jgi:hypothetical protein
MSPAGIVGLVDRRPFEPFRIFLMDGSTYEIRHPKLVMVGQRSMVVGIAKENGERPVDDRMATMSLLHVVRIEPVEAPAE